MSILGGLLTGYLAMHTLKKHAKGKNELNFGGLLEVKHAIDGRIRLNSEKLKNDKVGNAISLQLSKVDGITKVSNQPITGSMVILFDAKKVDADVLIGAVIRLLGLEEELKKAQRGKVYDEIHHVNNAVNQAVLDKTNGLMDLRTALPMGFMGLAAYQIVRDGGLKLPPAATLLYWSYSRLNLWR